MLQLCHSDGHTLVCPLGNQCSATEKHFCHLGRNAVPVSAFVANCREQWCGNQPLLANAERVSAGNVGKEAPLSGLKSTIKCPLLFMTSQLKFPLLHQSHVKKSSWKSVLAAEDVLRSRFIFSSPIQFYLWHLLEELLSENWHLSYLQRLSTPHPPIPGQGSAEGAVGIELDQILKSKIFPFIFAAAL